MLVLVMSAWPAGTHAPATSSAGQLRQAAAVLDLRTAHEFLEGRHIAVEAVPLRDHPDFVEDCRLAWLSLPNPCISHNVDTRSVAIIRRHAKEGPHSGNPQAILL